LAGTPRRTKKKINAGPGGPDVSPGIGLQYE
jgi:hypothetical protein